MEHAGAHHQLCHIGAGFPNRTPPLAIRQEVKALTLGCQSACRTPRMCTPAAARTNRLRRRRTSQIWGHAARFCMIFGLFAAYLLGSHICLIIVHFTFSFACIFAYTPHQLRTPRATSYKQALVRCQWCCAPLQPAILLFLVAERSWCSDPLEQWITVPTSFAPICLGKSGPPP